MSRLEKLAEEIREADTLEGGPVRNWANFVRSHTSSTAVRKLCELIDHITLPATPPPESPEVPAKKGNGPE